MDYVALGRVGEREGSVQQPEKMHGPGSAQQGSLLGVLTEAAAVFTRGSRIKSQIRVWEPRGTAQRPPALPKDWPC